MSLKYLLNLHHFSSISRRLSVNARRFLKKHGSFLKKHRSFSKKRGRFSEKRWTFSKKRGSFFQPLPRKDFSQQIETQKKQEIKDQQAWKFNF